MKRAASLNTRSTPFGDVDDDDEASTVDRRVLPGWIGNGQTVVVVPDHHPRLALARGNGASAR
ncbi:MAG: hypothetical protein IPM29_25075 [Planctomycetes bacterium]|nr:hypothetical protein [Planctomycetota bacterium]